MSLDILQIVSIFILVASFAFIIWWNNRKEVKKDESNILGQGEQSSDSNGVATTDVSSAQEVGVKNE